MVELVELDTKSPESEYMAQAFKDFASLAEEGEFVNICIAAVGRKGKVYKLHLAYQEDLYAMIGLLETLKTELMFKFDESFSEE